MKRGLLDRTSGRCAVLALVCFVATIGGAAAGSRREARNLVLISVDTLRADRLGCYGNPRPTSPRLDALAQAGVLFEDASTAAPWTKPAHATLLTGLYPSRHGMTSMTSTLANSAVPIAEWLSRRGFRTAAIVNTRLMATHGFERGFDTVDASELPHGQAAGSGITDAAIAWLSAQGTKKRFFLFLHYMDMHSDYESTPEHREQFVGPYDGPLRGSTQELYRIAERRLDPTDADLRHLLDLYDASLRQTDSHLGRLFDALRASGRLDTTLIVVTSDHGEEFLDHGGVLHGHSQYQELVRVPLVLHGPGVAAGRRQREPVSLVDVVPTALGLLGVPAPTDLDGIPLEPLWQTPGSTLPARFLFFEADITFPPPAPGVTPPGTRRAVRFGKYKLHYDTRTRQVQLYDLDQDPRETRNLRETQPEIAGALLDRLTAFLERPAASAPGRELTVEQLEALRSLGYVGGP